MNNTYLIEYQIFVKSQKVHSHIIKNGVVIAQSPIRFIFPRELRDKEKYKLKIQKKLVKENHKSFSNHKLFNPPSSFIFFFNR